MRIRSSIILTIQKYLDTQDFIQINVPILTHLDCEGGGETFEITTLPKNFFPKKTYLSVSGQLYLEIAAAAFARVFCLGPTFRAEHSNTKKHLAEFWMLELEISFTTLESIMDICENIIKHTIKHILDNCSHEIDILFELNTLNNTKYITKNILENILKYPFHHITYKDAILLLQEHINDKKIQFINVPIMGNDLHTEHERYIVEKYFNNVPVFITNYPSTIKPFYMSSSSFDTTTSLCFDLIVPNVGEVCGGSLRETSYDILSQNIKKNSLNIDSYDWYLQLRKFGTTPHGGFGIGIERLLMFIIGVDNIRDVVLAPRSYMHLTI